jgi:hypothetical protein
MKSAGMTVNGKQGMNMEAQETISLLSSAREQI